MTPDLVTWLAELGRLEHFGYLVLGWALAWGWQGGKAFMRNREFHIRWQRLVYIACAGVLIFVTLSTHRSSECVQEFNRVLQVRSQITMENDQLSIQQREIIYGWMHALVFPPPHIAPLANDDPRRQQWAVQLTLDADAAFAESLDEQRRNDEKRKQNPLPNATCT